MVLAADGTRLHVTSAGPPNAAVSVVFAHGWALSSDAWADEFRSLAESARVVAYDQRGHGRSGRSDTAPSIDLLGDDLREVLEQAAPEGPVVLAGHSMGGMTIMSLAARHPEVFGRRVAGVALVSTAAFHPPPSLGLTGISGWLVPRAFGLLMALGGLLAGPFDWFRRRFLPPSGRLVRRLTGRYLFGSRVSADAVLRGAELIDATPMRTIATFYAALRGHDKRGALTPLRRVRTLIMVGDLDRLTPPALSRAITAELPEAELVVVLGAGHMLPMERPELVTAHLSDLVERATPVG